MKFHLALFLIIYLIGVEAKHKHKRPKAGKTLQLRVDGLRSFLDGGRDIIPFNDHGNIAHSLPKYGHFGLNVESTAGGRDNSPDGSNAKQVADEHNTVVQEANSLDVGSVERSSNTEVQTHGKLLKITSQGNQSPAGSPSSIQTQFFNLGQPPINYGSALSQSGLYTPPSAPGNVRTQPSTYGQRGSNPYYGAALFQGSQIGTPYGQGVQGPVSPLFASASTPNGQVGAPFQHGSNPGQYVNLVQPAGYPGLGIGAGQGAYGQLAQQQSPLFGPPANLYGPGGQASTQYRQSDVQVEFINGGQTAGFYGNIHPQNGQLGMLGQWGLNGKSDVQGLYPTGVGQPTNYYGTTPGNNAIGQGVQQSYLWPPTSGTPGASGQIGGPLTALGSQQYVPGLYGGVEKAPTSNSLGAGDPTIHALSRYINAGFYYPPPQHLNANPNMWDPAARYYFALDGQELPQDVSGPSHSNAFPITYSQI